MLRWRVISWALCLGRLSEVEGSLAFSHKASSIVELDSVLLVDGLIGQAKTV